MRTTALTFLIGVGAALAQANPASAVAGLAPEWTTCTGNADVDWRQQAKSCTAIILSVTETPQNRALAYRNRGNAHAFHLKDYDRAIADYSEAVNLDPEFPDAYHNRGWSFQQKGARDRAIADYRKALDIDPTHASARMNLLSLSVELEVRRSEIPAN